MNKLKTVTISGADDNTSMEEMAKISAEFPFVEWGILISPSNYGKPRYPTMKWLTEFSTLVVFEEVKKSLHLCGNHARIFTHGEVTSQDNLMDEDEMIEMIHYFNRVQLNVSRELNKVNDRLPYLVERMSNTGVPEFLLQIPLGAPPSIFFDANSSLASMGSDQMLLPFLDVSGGTGVEGQWKLDFEWKGLTGFAGGIKPSNVESIIKSITQSLHPEATFWIDMESGVRNTEDKLDLDLVRNVLTTCKNYIAD